MCSCKKKRNNYDGNKLLKLVGQKHKTTIYQFHDEQQCPYTSIPSLE